MKTLKTKLLGLVVALGLTGCAATQAELDAHYERINAICKTDVRQFPRGRLMMPGISVECLEAQYGVIFKSNRSMYSGANGEIIATEQRMYDPMIVQTYRMPKYIYIRNGVVTSFQY